MKKIMLSLLILIVACLTVKAQDSLQQYVAKYKFPDGSAVTEVDVVLENGVLQINSSMGSSGLDKTTLDTFSIPSYNGIVIFTRNETKKITGIKIDVMNISLEGIREEKENILNNFPPAPINKFRFPLKNIPALMLQEEVD
jgi:hypothetical protein